jgi:alpha-tubulin suppressor-like RCC1 family protein
MLLQLPYDILALILSFMDTISLARFAATCVCMHAPCSIVSDVLRRRAARRGCVCPVVSVPGKLAMLEWRRDEAWSPVASGPLSSFFVASGGRLVHCGTSAESGEMAMPSDVASMVGVRVNSVTVGWFFTAAISTSGDVYTWGVCENGCLGHGRFEEDVYCDVLEIPKKVRALAGHRVLTLATGHGHCVAVTDIGGAWSWGRDVFGQCGHGVFCSEGGSRSRLVPTRIQLLIGEVVIHASAGLEHSLVVTDEGALYSFGCGSNGRLGNGSSASSCSPTHVFALRGVRVASTAAGDDHSLALAANGTVFACGNNRSGQLGMGYKGLSERLPRLVMKLSSVRALAAGDRSSCAVTVTGELFVWGLGHYRERRLGYREAMHSPVRVVALAGEFVVAVSTSVSNTVAVTNDGSVFVWGWVADAVGVGCVAVRRYPFVSCTRD